VSDSGLSTADPSRWITGVTPNNNVVRLAALAVALALATQGKALGVSAKVRSIASLRFHRFASIASLSPS